MDKTNWVYKRGGYLYTVSIIMLMIPLVFLVVFYTTMSQSPLKDTAARVRCDELYFIVQDIDHDLERAMLIFGRRAAVYAINDVVSNNRTLGNYTFHNCTDFIFDGNGSEAAIAELVLCGTLYGENVTYMTNHTLPVWISRIDEDAEEMGYQMQISVINFSVVPHDAWNFALILTAKLEISDRGGVCYYSGNPFIVTSLASIIGLEDPLYPVRTNNRVSKYITQCDPNLTIDSLAGCSREDWGNQSATGHIVFYSSIKDDPGLAGFCSGTEDVSNKVLVLDMDFTSCSGGEYDCFNISNENHLAAVIEYANNDPDSSFIRNCSVTIPWISATGKMDNETLYGSGYERDPNCANSSIATGACVIVRNIPSCDVHQVLMSYNNNGVNTSCYVVSNVSGYTSCSPLHPNGPSFFDRLDGRLSLSERYVEQAEYYFSNKYIGIESLISPYELEGYGITPAQNRSWIDYLYWSNASGCPVSTICQSGSYEFSLDCQHAYLYGLDTSCTNASGVHPVSTITSPENDTMFYNCPTLYINGSADDCDGEITSVELSINGELYDTNWDGMWWNYTLYPTETNKYVLRSVAIDNDGLQEETPAYTTVFILNCSSGDNTRPPAPDLYSPTNGTGTTTLPDLFWSEVSDSSGIYRYQIVVDEEPADWIDPQVNDYSWSTSYTPSTELDGNRWYRWKVRAQDNSGNWGDWSTEWVFKTSA